MIYTFFKRVYPCLALLGLPFLSSCDSKSCEGERSSAKVESSSSIYPVDVAFHNLDTQQTFSVTGVRSENAKTLPALPAGQYSIIANVYMSVGQRQVRLTSRLEDCFDYGVYVYSTGLSDLRMVLNSDPR